MKNSLLALIALIGLSGTVIADSSMMVDQGMGADMDDMEMPDFDSPEFQQMIEQLQSQFKKMEEQMPPEKRERLKAMQEKTQKLYDTLDQQQEKIRELQQEKAEQKAEVKELKQEVADLQEKIAELQERIQSLMKQKQQLANALEETTDVLAAGDDGEQPAVMTEEEKEEARKKMVKIDEEISATQIELDEIQGEYGSLSSELTEKRDVKRGTKAKIKEEEVALVETEKELENEQAQGEDIFSGMDFSSTFDTFEQENQDDDTPEPFANDAFTQEQGADIDQFALQEQGG